jgi:hypothetical protein
MSLCSFVPTSNEEGSKFKIQGLLLQAPPFNFAYYYARKNHESNDGY